MADFFISYRGVDVEWAKWIAWELEQAQFDVIYQDADFRDGLPLIEQINNALVAAAGTIAVISPAYFESPWCKIEWQTAATLHATKSGYRFLLIVIKPSDLPPVLRRLTWIELIGMDEAAARKRLLKSVQRDVPPPATKPAFPVQKDAAGSELPRGLIGSFLQALMGVRYLAGPVEHHLEVPAASVIPGQVPITAPNEFPSRTKVWNVPHAWNPNFVGRDVLLRQLKESLASGQPAAVTQAVTGLGGVGKTQLATMYAYRHAADYELVWWVNSESPATLAAEFGALAEPLGLPERDAQDVGVKVAAVRRELERREGWLVIFDNVERPDHLNGCLPQRARGHVIITSRDPNWRGVAQPLVVPTLARADSIDLLQRRSGKADPVAAGKLAELLGDLPVALVQAAGYIERTNKSFAAYLELFEQHRERLWKKDKPPKGYAKTVAETLTLSLEKVETHSPPAADLLRLCAFLAPDKIPLDVLSACVPGVEYSRPQPLAPSDESLGARVLDPSHPLAFLADPIERDAAIEELRGYSLVEVSEPHLSLHRLVQAVVRDRLPLDDQKTWCAAAVRVLNAAMPEDIPTNLKSWPICDRLVDHALVVTEHAERLGSAPEQASYVANQSGVYFQQRAQFREAEVVQGRALRIAEQAYGPDHPEVAIRLNNLAQLLKVTNCLAEAEPLMRRGLAIEETSKGLDHPHVAIQLNNLAQLLQATNRLAEAEPLMRRALDIDTQSYGAEHPDVAIDLNNLAQLLKATNRLAEAEPLMRRALDIGEQSLGPDHAWVANPLNNLAQLLQATNRLAEAEPLMRRALDIDTQSYGAEHPNVARDLNNLARLLQDTNRLAEAEPLMRRALAIDEQSFGPDHPNIAYELNNLGMMLVELGEVVVAVGMLERAFGIFQRSLGDEHPNTKRVQANLGRLRK